MELRDGKHMILTGETNVFPQSDAAIKEMNRLEKEYLELFTGKPGPRPKPLLQIIPAKTMSGKKSPLAVSQKLLVLFRLIILQHFLLT